MTVANGPVRHLMESYLEALISRGAFEEYLTDEITLEMIGDGPVVQGRDEVAALMRAGHFQLFDSTVEVVSIIVDEERQLSACEIIFRGRHTGEFAGIPVTGREVEVPYSATYEITDRRISAARIYGLLQGLVAALTA